MSARFFNPWAGRMNGLQFILATAVCCAGIYLGTEFIPDPALIIAVNIFLVFMIFVFVMRRFNDKYNPPRHAYIPVEHDTMPDEEFLLGAAKFFGVLLAVLSIQKQLTDGSHYLLQGLVIIVLFLIIFTLRLIFFPLAIGLSLIFFCYMVLGGNPSSNKYGHPPVGMNFSTTLPETYPDMLAAPYEAKIEEDIMAERALREHLSRIKSGRKAGVNAVTEFVDFQGRA